MPIMALLLVGLGLGSPADAPECRDVPSRASLSYWTYVEACGCGNLEPPSRASLDYDRFLKACSQWRQRNPQVNVVVPEAPPPETTLPPDSTPTTVDTSPADAPECRDVPSRVLDAYWAYIEACGCAKLDPPSRAALDYDRFLKACSQWRQRNPQVNVIVLPTPSTPSPSTKPKPTPTPSPKSTSKPGS